MLAEKRVQKGCVCGRVIFAALSTSVCGGCAADTYIGVRVEYMPNRVLIKFDIMRSCAICALTVFWVFLRRGISSAA